MPLPHMLLALSVLMPSSGALAQAPDWTRVQPLPSPRGSYAIGTRVLQLADSSRATSRHIGTRPLTVQLWYPAIPGKGTRAPYLQEGVLLDSMIARRYLELGADDMRGWRAVRLSARVDAPAARPPTARGWPVLVFSHGMGVARAQYSSLEEELASRGYVVVAIDHPIGGFTLDPAGRVLAPGVDSLAYGSRPLASIVRDWSRDAAFVLRRLARLHAGGAGGGAGPPIDTTRAGMLGHSLGGAAALQACRDGVIFRACADMDGSPFGDVEEEAIGRPFLTLLSEPDRSRRPPPKDSAEAAARERFAAMGRERDSTWAAIGARNGGTPWFAVKLVGTGHFSFSDAPFQAPALLRDVGATMSPSRMHVLVSDLLLDFFDHFLRERPLRRLRAGATTLR